MQSVDENGVGLHIENDPTQRSFNVASFAEAVLGTPARPIVGSSLPVRELLSRKADIVDAFAQGGLDLVVVDCARSEHAVTETLLERLGALHANGRVGATALRLAEAAQSVDLSPRLRMDGLARLWAQLETARPSILLVVHTSSASEDDHAILRHFARFVYADPLVELAETQLWDPPAGRLLFVGEPGFELASVELDFGVDTTAAVRDFLGRDEIVQRFIASTDGDIARLSELVEYLPQNAQHMALFRYDALTVQERAIVDALAVVGASVAPEHLHDTVALLGASEYFAKSLRGLEGKNLIHRSMGGGRIVVGLHDPSFGEALLAQMQSDRRSDVHRAFADAERARHPENPNVEILASHYCEAGDDALALEFGLRAVTLLRSQRRLVPARRLAEALANRAAGTVRDALELELAGILEEMGEFRLAIDACDQIGERTPELSLRRGQLLARVGDWDDAIASFDQVISEATPQTIARQALLARSDAAYAIGEHDHAVEVLESLAIDLGAETSEPSVRDRSMLSARNTLGKISIVRSEFDRAVELFEQNRDLALAWGWEEEVARAQANLGVVALQRDDHDEAFERLTEALQASETRGSLPRAYCLMNLASVHQRRDQYGEALQHCLEAMRCAKKAGDASAYAVSSRNLATIYQDLGAYDRAIGITEHLRSEYEADEQTLAGGWNLLVRAQLLHETGELVEAESCYGRLRGDRLSSVFGTEATLRIAEIHLELGHVSAAEEELGSLELGERALYQGLRTVLKADVALRRGEPALALELAQAAYDVLEEVGEKNEPVRARLIIADALIALDRADQARTELQRELTRIRRVALSVPESFQRSFWSKSRHQQLVSRIQELDGSVPSECVICSDVEEPLAQPLLDAEFWAWRSKYNEFIGEDPRLHQVFRLIERVAKSDATVLAYGASGTGKELIASALHRRSDRFGNPFVKVNCAAFVENLLLSELFGHEKGAFTGAAEQKQGRFERADGGTIFLDEIGDISPKTQVALLRVLQEGTFERVGGSKTIETDVRVVCATNRDLEEMVRRGEFRLDLYYRLKGVVIEMPALRERREDIARLATHFAGSLGTDGPKRFSHESLQLLANYSWPGNVRELQNFVRSILLFVDGDVVGLENIMEFQDFFVSGEFDESLAPINVDQILGPAPVEELTTIEEARPSYGYVDPEEALVEKIVSGGHSLAEIKKRLEIECIKRALIETGGNVTQAADILQMKRPRLSQIINADDELSALKARLAG